MPSKNLTVAVLREELGKRGAPTMGLKSDLAARLDALLAPSSPEASTAAGGGGGGTATKSRRPEPDAPDSGKRARRGQLFPAHKDAKDMGAAVESSSAAGGDGAPTHKLYVPEALHKLVGYSRRGDAKEATPLAPGEAALFAFVAKECALPPDLEVNHKYGPLSGSSFEGRAIGAFVHGLLGDARLSPAAKAAKKVVRRSVLDGNLEGAAAAQ
jgi:hypothetical protein